LNIYVTNLSYEVTQRDLWLAFEPFGLVRSVKIIKDKYNGKSKEFGFVDMPSETEARFAINSLNGKEFMGKQLKVNTARRRPKRGRRRKPCAK